MIDVVLSGVADLPYYPIGIQMYGGLDRVLNSLATTNIPSVTSHERATGVRSGHASIDAPNHASRERVLGSETERTDLLKVG